MNKIGIDVSHWQGSIEWRKVKNSFGLDFAILKAGGSDAGLYTDNKFRANYEEAKKQGIPVGAYFFVGKKFNADNAIQQAQYFLSILKNKTFEMPIFIDVEILNVNNKTANTNAVIDFCDYIEKHNGFIGVYGSDFTTFKYMLDYDKMKRFCLWVARYGTKPKYVKTWHIWQYSCSGVIRGITEKVDMNCTPIDFPRIIIKKGLNRF